MKKAKILGSFGVTEVIRDSLNDIGGREARERRGQNELLIFITIAINNTIKIDIRYDNLINGSALTNGQREELTIWQMPASPKIHSSGISMLYDELGISNINIGKFIVVGSAMDKRRTNSKKRNVKSPRAGEIL